MHVDRLERTCMENYTSTSLPPRKRLLTGVRSLDSTQGAVLQGHVAPSNFVARLIDIANSVELSHEEVVEAAKLVCRSAAETAAATRLAALEKAAVAAKARAAARAALEWLKFAYREQALPMPRSGMKNVPMKALYNEKQRNHHVKNGNVVVDDDDDDDDGVAEHSEHHMKRKKVRHGEVELRSSSKPDPCVPDCIPSDSSTVSSEKARHDDLNEHSQPTLNN